MARCDCAGASVEGCTCVLNAGENVTVVGTGQALDPWVVSGSPALTGGTAVSIAGNAINVDVSPLADNTLVVAGDGGLYVPPPAAAAALGDSALSAAAPIVAAGALGSVVFLTEGTYLWTKAANPAAAWLRVRVIGGGGGGAGATSVPSEAVSRGGGAGGNYAESWIEVSTLGESTTVVVGAGGAGGEQANGAGGTGGQSSFGLEVVALGGLGSPAVTPSATAGVSLSGGPQGAGTQQVHSPGERGGRGIWHSAGVGMAGDGGSGGAGYGAGGSGGISDGPGHGQPGAGPGGGGGGAHSQDAVPASGGAGAPGAVFVEMFG